MEEEIRENTQNKKTKQIIIISIIVVVVLSALLSFVFFQKVKSSKETYNLFNNDLALFTENDLYGYINKKRSRGYDYKSRSN